MNNVADMHCVGAVVPRSYNALSISRIVADIASPHSICEKNNCSWNMLKNFCAVCLQWNWCGGELKQPNFHFHRGHL